MNDPLPGTAAFTETLAVCCAVAMIMLFEFTPAGVTALEEVPGAIVTTPLRLNFAMPVTESAVPEFGAFVLMPVPSAPTLASTPVPPTAVARIEVPLWVSAKTPVPVFALPATP
jgi:hypothetical protein